LLLLLAFHDAKKHNSCIHNSFLISDRVVQQLFTESSLDLVYHEHIARYTFFIMAHKAEP